MAGYPPNPLNPFENAPILVREIKDHVTGHQNELIARADATRDTAANVIRSIAESLKAISPDDAPAPPAPVFPRARGGSINLSDLGGDSFGKISPVARGRFTAHGVAPISKEDIKDFDPVFDNLTIPDAPTPRADPVFPDAPVFGEIALPVKPAGQRPNLPDLVELVIPNFAFTPLPPFDEASPEFEGSSVSAVLQWSEVPYQQTILEEEMAVVRRMWAGGTGLPPEVERALWERAASREDVAVSRDISAAATEFSGRGFTLPPGMLVNRIDAIRTEGQLKKQTLGRDVMIKVADTHIENLRFACQQAIASENVLIGLWSQMAQRGFEAAKAQLESELALLNAQVAIFNARQSAYQTAANVHKIALEERALELEKFKAELEAEVAKGQINEQRIKVFLGLYDGLKADAELYKAEMQGAQLESELQRNEVEKFKAGVQAAGELIQADKLRYDAYESRVKGETAKAQLLESQGRAYSAYVSGKVARSEIDVKNQQAELQVLDLQLRAFLGNLERDKVQLQAETAAIQATAEAHRTNTQRYTAEMGAKTALAELDMKALDSETRNMIALYDVEIRKYSNAREQLIRVASLQSDGLKAIGQMHSTLAAGAMAGISLGATIGADAKVGANGNSTVTQNL